MPGEKVGWLNRAFQVVYRVRLLGKAFKTRTRVGYYGAKYAALGALLYWLLA